jgi:hypothetical protein
MERGSGLHCGPQAMERRRLACIMDRRPLACKRITYQNGIVLNRFEPKWTVLNHPEPTWYLSHSNKINNEFRTIDLRTVKVLH